MAGRYKLLAFSAVRSGLVHLTASEIDGGWDQQPIHIVTKSKAEDSWNMRTNLSLPLRISGGGWSNHGSSSSIPQDDPRDEGLGEAALGLTHPGNNEHATNWGIENARQGLRRTKFRPAVEH
jgi:hypothetical protein